MIRATVSGKVWASRRIESVPTGAYLEVETEKGDRLIAFDPLGCAPGEAVLITQGSVAAAFFTGQTAPIDALIIGSIDEETPNKSGKTRKS
ncbi:EutN/CcmL family microcompartment protein [Roseovarius sp. Pro17]|uniref:EutN/CcmL family microcompartment protein n=1 Tax=Roseovarius sp. Pro17 TaxID=3108175 RepID=UPI002D7740C8|nr:EutN/CcmL family microcompartment protein [Roseovarius sp. Pro17]